jgi:hypothetical protein
MTPKSIVGAPDVQTTGRLSPSRRGRRVRWSVEQRGGYGRACPECTRPESPPRNTAGAACNRGEPKCLTFGPLDEADGSQRVDQSHALRPFGMISAAFAETASGSPPAVSGATGVP